MRSERICYFSEDNLCPIVQRGILFDQLSLIGTEKQGRESIFNGIIVHIQPIRKRSKYGTVYNRLIVTRNDF